MEKFHLKKRSGAKIIKANPPQKREQWMLRGMVFLAMSWLTIFLWWFFSVSRIGYAPLYWCLTGALVLKLLRMVYEWYHYLELKVPAKPHLTKKYKVDMLTTYCKGEPRSMVIRTLKKMVAVRYPHTTYLCDESDDDALKAVCAQLGVVHVTRIEKKHAKAGNINNALRQASGEICIIMDPDHEPVPQFIDQVIPYFEDPKVGYVQCVQGYYNQKEGFVAKAAAEQTYHFYGPIMMTMNSYGTPQAIGANCAFRREALDSIGGHAAGLTEDMHTSMKLQAKGWKALYIPEMLSKGLVPSTLSAFYKQQLKWSRGTFELFFEVLPGLLKNLSWRQRIHHLLAPLHYLSGLVTLINILVPVLALFLSEIPWRVDLETFILFYSPLILMTLLIRQYAQKWLMKETECGFHLQGGVLELGTWWIYVVGFVYSIFRINVPYIPTPKEDKPENNWTLVLPNLAACLLSIAAVLYGLHTDYNPYSKFMAMFALLNAGILGVFSITVQQKLMNSIQKTFKSIVSNSLLRQTQVSFWKAKHLVYYSIRHSAVLLGVIMIFALLSYTTENSGIDKNKKKMAIRAAGGFYKGLYLPSNDRNISLEEINAWEGAAGYESNIISMYQSWGPESIEQFPDSILNVLIREKHVVPMITWEPWSSGFPEFKQDFNLAVDRKVMAAISEGRFDAYLSEYSAKIKSLQGPVFLRFAHEPDNPQYPWSGAGNNTPKEFVEAHRHIVNYFAMHGVSNVSWVWNPWNAASLDQYYPGDDFVDWVGITGLNYGTASTDQRWKSFQEIYSPFRAKVLSYKKPVMISEFGSTSYGGSQHAWLTAAFQNIRGFKEIQSLTFFYSNQDKNWATLWRPENSNGYIDWTFSDPTSESKLLSLEFSTPPFNSVPLVHNEVKNSSGKTYTSPWKMDSMGVRFLVDGKPFYIKGVAYNTGHDWQDGNIPLTKNQLRKDFAAIKAMGANTIRRYDISVYDQNILKVARENGLKVLYGFWFDPTIDYYADTAKLEEYLQHVESKVAEFKDDNTVIGWSVGNETWGLLKHQFSQPYLSHVRNSYVKFIQKLAVRIHDMDGSRPVLTAMEHSKDLSSELCAYRDEAPGIDILGINSYYIENIGVLDSLVSATCPGKPYLVSEFGPKGYWNEYLSAMRSDSLLIEESDHAKGAYYVRQWKNYVEAHRKNNIGGFVFCWHDRFEGTATWFGISDFKGRLKPAYYAIRKEWTKEPNHASLPDFQIQWQSAKLFPGKYHEFRALFSGRQNRKFDYEWVLMKENSMENYSGYIRTFEDGKKIFMKVPGEPGKYRLYLYASDEKGGVSTVSHGLSISYK